MAAIQHQPVDHVPLCFDGLCHGSVRFVTKLHPDPFERARFYLDLGADTAIVVNPPLYAGNGLQTKQWKEEPPGERYPLLFKEYITPRGSLRQVVRKTEDYPDAISLFSDHNVPAGRSKEYLIQKEEDLDKLPYILSPPAGKDLDHFYQNAKRARTFCEESQIFMSGYSAGVGDSVIHLSGVEPVLTAALENPAFLKRYVEIVSDWSLKRTEIWIEAGVDLIVRRGWYESTDFWSPALYRQFLFEPLKKEVDLAHQAGVKFTYVMNSGAMPLLDIFKEIAFDIYSNIDPLTPGTDLARIKSTIGDQIALCGGVNNNLVMEKGTEAEVEAAVADAMRILSPNSGFILAPGDSLDFFGTAEETTKRNFHKMIEVWRRLR
ncbi:MAG: uroporphyrinogen decarboxylase family protein [Planctomycetota bacterium]